jgi:hypothetical protein
VLNVSPTLISNLATTDVKSPTLPDGSGTLIPSGLAVKILNPGLGRAFGDINPPTDGVPRDQLTVPVSPIPSPNDAVLFEQPNDPNQKVFLPRYRILDQPPLQVALAQGAQDWTLKVTLEKYRAPEIEQSGRDAVEMAHTATVIFQHNLLVGGSVVGVKQLVFGERTDRPNGLVAILRGTDSALRDQIYAAMTDPRYGATLLVRRIATVAVPIVDAGGSGVVSAGEGVLRGTWLFSFDRGAETGAAGADVWWDQMTATQRQLVPQGSAQIVNLGAKDFNATDLAVLQGLSYGTAPIAGNADGTNQLGAGDIFAVLTGGRNFAKVEVVEYGYNLHLRWVTYKAAIKRRPVIGDLQILDGAPIAAIEQPPAVPLAQPSGTAPARFASSATLGRGFGTPDPMLRARPPIDGGGDTPVGGDVVPGGGPVGGVGPGGHPRPLPLPEPPAPASSYRITVYSDDEAMQPNPFVFAPGSYVFVNVGGGGGQVGLARFPVDFNGTSYTYYQDLSQPWLFYYLPDRLKLARRDHSPHYPAMSIRILATDDQVDHTKVTLAYTAMPYADLDRLQAAALELKKFIPIASLPQGVTGAVLQAMQVASSAMTYSLTLPSQAGTTGAMTRDHALVDLRSGIVDAVTMPIGDFQMVFAALFADTELFQGRVEVRLGAGATQVEHVDLIGRMADMSGAPPLDSNEQPDAASGGLNVTLQNAVESPVQVSSLTAKLRGGDTLYDAIIQGVSFDTPTTLAPGANTQPADSLTLTVVPQDPAAAGGALHAVFDLDGVKVQPDGQAVWNAILDPVTYDSYQHQITLEAYPSAFGTPPEAPDDTVLELDVDFKQGQTQQLKPSQLPADPNAPISVKVPLQLPISDYVLNTEQYNAFDYRVTTVRTSGSATADWLHVQNTDLVVLQ